MPRFGVYLPNVGWDGLASPSEIAEYARAAEDLGFDSLWVEDRFLHENVTVLEPLSTLAFAAAATSRIRLGTSILLVNLRNPLVVAKMIATLDYLSGGRVIIGASLGGRPEEYAAAGVGMRTRVTRFTETLAALRSLLERPGAARESALFLLPEIPLEPRPARRVPVLIGGRVDAALKRAALLADGWLASSASTAEEFAGSWAKVLDYAREAGRLVESLEPAKFVYVHCDPDPSKAFETLAARLPRYYRAGYDVERACLYGPPARCAQGAQRLLDAGVQTLIFSPVTHEVGQLQALAGAVIPLLH